METRLPEELFRHLPLLEQPHRLSRRPQSSEVIGVYNTVSERLMDYRPILEARILNVGLNALSDITEKLKNGTPLTSIEQGIIQDYSTLLDSYTANFGRRNLNVAQMVEDLKIQRSNGDVLSLEQQKVLENYQAGNFHLIPGLDHPLNQGSTVSRFIVPVSDQGINYAIDDGAPIEGLIRLIDLEIRDIHSINSISERQKNSLLAPRRRERDVLFTQSTLIYHEEDGVFHARNQLEAYFNYINELRIE